MQKVTDRLYKVEDDAGKERLVRGVDAREIEAVKVQNEQDAKAENDLIAEANKMIESQKDEAEQQAKAGEVNPPLVEGVTTTPRSLLRSNEPDFPANDEMFRESQNNPPKEETEGKPVTFPADFPEGFPGVNVFKRNKLSYSRVQNMTRDELVNTNGIGETTADAVLKFKAK